MRVRLILLFAVFAAAGWAQCGPGQVRKPIGGGQYSCVSTTAVVKTTITYAQLNVAATTQDFTLATVPATARIVSVTVYHTAAFSGGNLTALTVGVGRSGAGNDQDYAPSWNIMTAPATTLLYDAPGGLVDMASHVVIAHFAGTFSSGTFATNPPMAGSVTIWVKYEPLT